uniref:C-type lectin domain-containing protein n=1 Tax=Gadus morhua TaxID=8049 RepID=A0A8C5CZ66_GADMO
MNQDKRPSESCEEQNRGLCEKKIIKCLLKPFLCAYFVHVPHYSAILFHTFGVPSLNKSLMVLLGLLSVVMLARLIGLAVQHKKTASMERDIEQLLLTLKNLTEQRDALLCKQECPGGWKKFGCKCYKTSYTYQSWNKSRGFCVSHGADLVVVDSKEEMDFISRWYNGYFWLGATDAAGEGTWRWVDGTVLSLDDPFWRGPDGGEPRLYKNSYQQDKNCLRRASELNQYKWTDESCESTSFLVLCEQNLMK